MTLSRRRLVALAAAALNPVRAAHAAGSLRLVVPALPQVIDPHLAVTRFDRAIASELFVGLVGRDASGAIVPALAESWTESADGLTHTFVLRGDARWSDGRAIVADDVVFSFARALDAALAAPFAGTLHPIACQTGVSAIDAHTVKIVTSTRTSRLLEILAQPVAAVVPRTTVTRFGRDWTASDRIVCSGAFTPASSDGTLCLVRNPAAFDPSAADGVQFEIAESLEAAAERVRAGAVDLAWGFTAAPIVDRNLQRVMKADTGETLLHIAVNTTRPKLDNRELRHALGMMVDRDRLIRALRLGDAPNAAAPAYAAVPPSVHTATYPHPAPFARIAMDDRLVIAQVLAQEEGIVVVRPTEFQLIHVISIVNAAVVKAIGDTWAKIGVRLAVKALSEAAFAEALIAGAYDLALVSSAVTDTTAWSYLTFLAGTAGPDNLPHYAEKDFDRFLNTAAAETEPPSIAWAISNAEGLLAEDQILLPILVFHAGIPIGSGVGGWEPNAHGLHPLRFIARR